MENETEHCVLIETFSSAGTSSNLTVYSQVCGLSTITKTLFLETIVAGEFFIVIRFDEQKCNSVHLHCVEPSAEISEMSISKPRKIKTKKFLHGLIPPTVTGGGELSFCNLDELTL